MKDYIQIGIEKGLISLNEDRSCITDVYQKKERNVFLHMKCVRDTAILYFGGFTVQQRIPSSYLETLTFPCHQRESRKRQLPMFMNKSSEPRPGRKKASAFLTMLSKKWSGLILGGADLQLVKTLKNS